MSFVLNPIKTVLKGPLCRILCCSLLLIAGSSYASQQSAPVKNKTKLSEETSLLRYPTAKPFVVTSKFDAGRVNPVTRKRAPHEGIDFSMPIGSTVVSTGAGEVVIAKYSRSAGYYILIRHGNNYSSQYMHLSKLLVKPGQKVKQGQKIALSGNTGRSTGAHLHYELHHNNKPIDPLSLELQLVNNFDFSEMNIDVQLVKATNKKRTNNKAAVLESKSEELLSASLQDENFQAKSVETKLFGDDKIFYSKRVRGSEN